MLVGIDLCDVDQVERAITDHGDRYLTRVFTSLELAQTGSRPQRLAARFAAKEATIKALGVSGEGVGWTSIGVADDQDGRPAIRLSGAVAELAQRRGVDHLSLSLTHASDVGAAVVIGEARA